MPAPHRADRLRGLIYGRNMAIRPTVGLPTVSNWRRRRRTGRTGTIKDPQQRGPTSYRDKLESGNALAYRDFGSVLTAMLRGRAAGASNRAGSLGEQPAGVDTFQHTGMLGRQTHRRRAVCCAGHAAARPMKSPQRYARAACGKAGCY